MPACPNCGRQTLRTKDWACQWCGYPLISRAYKQIDKTFKELQEERNLPPKYEEAETDNIPKPEVKDETRAEPGTPPEPKRFSFFRRKPKPRPEPVPETPPLTPQPVMQEEPKPEKPQPAPETPPPAPQPVMQEEPKPEQPQPAPETPPPAPQPVMQEEPKPEKPQPAPEVETEPRPSPPPAPAPEPQVKLEPESELPPAPVPEPPPQLPPSPAPELEPEPAPVQVIPLDSIKEGMEITVDQLNALFKADKSGANSRFKDKVVIVKGLVDKVFVREHLEIRYIVLIGSRKKELWSVRCSFEKEGASGLNRINEGQEVAVRGKYDSYGNNIIFKNCSLV